MPRRPSTSPSPPSPPPLNIIKSWIRRPRSNSHHQWHPSPSLPSLQSLSLTVNVVPSTGLGQLNLTLSPPLPPRVSSPSHNQRTPSAPKESPKLVPRGPYAPRSHPPPSSYSAMIWEQGRAGGRHHPFPKDKVPYPRSYDWEILDL
jgi:hypothetical protein